VERGAFIRECKRIGLEKHEIPPWISSGAHATTHHFTNSNIKGNYFIVCIEPQTGKTREQEYALLTHEAVHVFDDWMAPVERAVQQYCSQHPEWMVLHESTETPANGMVATLLQKRGCA